MFQIGNHIHHYLTGNWESSTILTIVGLMLKSSQGPNIWNSWPNSINNGNWTEWSAIWAKIICMISKSNECAVRVQFEIASMISDQNCTTWGSITTLLHPFWNRPNTGLGQFKYFIDALPNCSEIKFIHFLGWKK